MAEPVQPASVSGMSGGGDDGFFSSEIVLIVGGLVLFLVLVQMGLVGSAGEWLGNLMTRGAPLP